jgi:hypothetical protein
LTRGVQALATAVGIVVVTLSPTACGGAKPGPAPATPPTPYYAVTTSSIDGHTPDNVGHWHARVGRIGGGTASVAEAFNKASEAAAQQQIDAARRDAGSGPYPAGWQWTIESKSAVTFRPTAIAEVITGVYYGKGAAHPVTYIDTLVIDTRTAKPITLADLFVSERDGLNRLSERTNSIGFGRGPIANEPGDAPIEQNFANWIPTAEGMQLHFADYQFFHGTPVITVPWSALTDLLAPAMVALSR